MSVYIQRYRHRNKSACVSSRPTAVIPGSAMKRVTSVGAEPSFATMSDGPLVSNDSVRFVPTNRDLEKS